MSILTINSRKIGADDISWGLGSFAYNDPWGVDRTMPQVNASTIPATVDFSILQQLLDVIAVSNSTELVSALSYLGTSKAGTIYLKGGAYTAATNMTVPNNVLLWFSRGAVLQAANGVTVTINGSIWAGPWQIFSWAGTGNIDLSGSPTQKCYLDWWGAVSTSDHSGSDCSAIVQKAISDIGDHQTLKLSPGWYNVNHFSLTNTSKTYSIEGSGKSGIYSSPCDGFWLATDVGTDGITIGVTSSASTLIILKDLCISGPQNCCRYGVVFNMLRVRLDNVNFWMGATDYAVNAVGCIGSDALHVRSYPNGASSAYGPAGVLQITYGLPGGSLWSSQGINASINCFGSKGGGQYYFTKPVLNILGSYSISANYIAGDTIRITGVIDQWADAASAFKIENGHNVRLDSLYCEGSAASTSLISNSTRVTITGLSTTEGITVSNSDRTFATGCSIGGTLKILPDCKSTVIGPGVTGGIGNYAGDTIFLSGLEYNSAAPTSTLPVNSVDSNNYIYNPLFTRWQSDRPDGGWYKQTNQTWTQESTYVHATTYSAKSVVTSDQNAIFFFDTPILKVFRGKVMTFSYWQMFPSGQTLTSAPYASLSFTCPARVNSTAYTYGDAVVVSGRNYLCVQAGTSAGSPPTFNYGENGTTTDGTVIWRSEELGAISYYNSSPLSTDSVWRNVAVTSFIPNNCTDMRVDLTHGGSSVTMYLAEVAAMVGRQVPKIAVPNNPYQVLAGEGAWMISDSYPPDNASSKYNSGYNFLKGDTCFSRVAASGSPGGWTCTTAGSPGTWKAWANLP